MATHAQNIKNLREAVYGEQVRSSMIELFEEDFNLASNTLNIGTEVTSSTSKTTKTYPEGSYYLNTNDYKLWRLNSESKWEYIGILKGADGKNGADGTSLTAEYGGKEDKISTLLIKNSSGKLLATLNIADGSDGSGNSWYKGTIIQGQSSIPTRFSNTEVNFAYIGDCYINTEEGGIYQCSTGGDNNNAYWVYVMTISGGSSGGASNWVDLNNKPFDQLGAEFTVNQVYDSVSKVFKNELNITEGMYQTQDNLVIEINENSLDTQYPSASCVYKLIGNITSLLDHL